MELSPRLSAVLCVLQLPLMLVIKSDADVVRLSFANLSSEPTSAPNHTSRQTSAKRDCSDFGLGSPSGVYTIYPDLETATLAYCDMDDGGGGWTMFQKRANVEPREDFQKDWDSYKWGFGSFQGEFWWGLQYLWLLTRQLDRIYELKVDLWDFEGQTRHAVYQQFTISSEEDGYRLYFNGFSGNAGDALDYHKGMKFSTVDRDNDEYDSGGCAVDYGGPWWYKSCYNSKLNSVYSNKIMPDQTGIVWYEWRGAFYSLNATTMKIRPTEKL